MSLSFTYNLTLKRNETRKFDLPDVKSSLLILNNFSITSDQKTFDIKLSGKETIVSYGEAVFYQKSSFDLSDQIAQIIDADGLTLTIKNLCTGKDANTVKLTIKLNYLKSEGNIIFNNIYTNLNMEGLANILEDVRKAGKYVTKVVWTSPNKLSTMELKPQFESQPGWLESRSFLADNNNQIIMDLSSDDFTADFIDQLKYYELTVPDNLERLGVIVYGYIN